MKQGLCIPPKIHSRWRHIVRVELQEVAGITVTALQEAGMSLFRQEAGNVAWDSNIEAIQDGQDQVRSVISSSVMSVVEQFERSEASVHV